MAEQRIIYLQSKKWKYVGFNRYFDCLQLLYVFEEMFWNICISNDFLVYSGSQLF